MTQSNNPLLFYIDFGELCRKQASAASPHFRNAGTRDTGAGRQQGSGKSTLALAIMRLLPPTCKLTGKVNFNGVDLLSISESKLRSVRGREIALILQSPTAALNPMLRIGTQLREAWHAHNPRQDRE